MSSLPSVGAVHRAVSRGSHCAVTTRVGAVAVATKRAGDGDIWGNYRGSSGVGWWQRWTGVMVRLAENLAIHDLIVALLVLR